MSGVWEMTDPEEIREQICGLCEPNPPCEFQHPHPEHPCGRKDDGYMGKTRCTQCGAVGEWREATESDLDSLYAEAWGIPDPGAL